LTNPAIEKQGIYQISEFQIKTVSFEARVLEPGLYIAATPIGNLGDITLRVLEALAGADLIACEDTRVTMKLLRHYGIETKMVSYHEHNAQTAGPRLIRDLKAGKSIVQVSDAGTPLVSDPGFRLINQAQEANIPVWPLPGATAPVAALVASGLPVDTWIFAGFLPTKQGARKSRLESFASQPSTLIFFESPNRISRTLADMMDVFGHDRMACVARELTKLHEETYKGNLAELARKFSQKTIKGEIVIIVAPPEAQAVEDTQTLLLELMKTMTVSKAAAEAALLTGNSKRDLYQQALSLKNTHVD